MSNNIARNLAAGIRQALAEGSEIAVIEWTLRTRVNRTDIIALEMLAEMGDDQDRLTNGEALAMLETVRFWFQVDAAGLSLDFPEAQEAEYKEMLSILENLGFDKHNSREIIDNAIWWLRLLASREKPGEQKHPD